MRVALIGCGLIGSSFALASRRAGWATHVRGFDRDPSVVANARVLGIVDDGAATIADVVTSADLVVIATPVGQARDVFASLVAALPADAVVTDVGSTKHDVVATARATLGDAIGRFVPGHPLAGRESHGPEAALATLFAGRRVLLTPVAETDPAAVDVVARAWQACGARVDVIDVDVHDRALSAVSHLPHLLAYTLVAQIADAVDATQKFGLAGAGFRDFSRIAASSPEMWRDIALANRDALLDDLDDYRARLDRLRAWLAASDGPSLEALFQRASIARTAWRDDG